MTRTRPPFKRIDGRETIRARVRDLAIAGLRPSQIAQAIERSTTYVCVTLNQLRKAGQLPKREQPASPEGKAG